MTWASESITAGGMYAMEPPPFAVTHGVTDALHIFIFADLNAASLPSERAIISDLGWLGVAWILLKTLHELGHGVRRTAGLALAGLTGAGVIALIDPAAATSPSPVSGSTRAYNREMSCSPVLVCQSVSLIRPTSCAGVCR